MLTVSCVKERKKLLINFHGSKKEKTADKVSLLNGTLLAKFHASKNVYNRKIRLLTMCHASNSYIHIYIHKIFKNIYFVKYFTFFTEASSASLLN